jgi:hypothetical protein
VGRDFSPIVKQWVYYHGRDYVDLPCATLVEDANRFVAQYNMKPVSLEEGEELKEALKKAVRDERSALAFADALMPDLFGTESQVKWAQEIRKEAIKTALDLRHEAFHNWSFEKAKRLSKYVTEVLRRKRSAKWFIDNRLDLKEFPSFNGGRRSIRIPKVQKSEARWTHARNVLRPETITHPGIVEILWPQKGGPLLNYEDDYDYFKLILSRHPKEKTSPYVEDLCQFLSILILTKFCRYDWDGSPSGWSGLRSGPAQIIRLQIAELARALLSMGYPVIVTDDEARALVRSRCFIKFLIESPNQRIFHGNVCHQIFNLHGKRNYTG